MIISTTETIPNKTVTEILGVARGSTVRARHFGKDIFAGLKNLVGGEISEYTKLQAQSREQAMQRMVEDAEKLGADYVFAPDIDEWSYNNAIENVALNDCSKIEVALGGAELLDGKEFDVIIANINKNILIQHYPRYAKALKSGGIMLNSGFFTTDKNDLIAEAEKFGFVFESIESKDEWALLEFKKK